MLRTAGMKETQAEGACEKVGAVYLSGGRRTVTDGPFAEAKELIAGFAPQNDPTDEGGQK